MPTVDDGIDAKFDPVTAADVDETNPRMVANQLRALQREVHSGFELMGQRILTAIERLTDKLDDLTDRQNTTDAEVAALKLHAAQTDARLAALEAPPPPPPPAPRRRKAKKR